MKIPKLLQDRHLTAASMARINSEASVQLAGPAPPAAPSPARSPFVYVLGTLGYSFRSGVRRDLFVQEMAPMTPAKRSDLLAYLEQNPTQAELLTWTISVDRMPIYALQPEAAFGSETYAWFRWCLGELPGDDVNIQVSLPGVIIGQAMLLSGEVLPVVQPALRGLYSWSTTTLAQQFAEDGVLDDKEQERLLDRIFKFQRRVYTELRNKGQLAQERATNYAATYIFQDLYTKIESYALAQRDYQIWEQAQIEQQAQPTVPITAFDEVKAARNELRQEEDLELVEIEVKRSPICRPDSEPDCWDVQLKLFNPQAPSTEAKTVYLLTVDVSEVVPVVIAEIHKWLED